MGAVLGSRNVTCRNCDPDRLVAAAAYLIATREG